MSTKKRRSNVVTKALLITALASGIAGMQATPAFADIINYYDYTNGDHLMEHQEKWGTTSTTRFNSFNTNGIDFSKEFSLALDNNYVRYSGDADESGNWYRGSMILYYTPTTYTTSAGNTFEAGKLYAIEYNGRLAYGDSSRNAFLLGDAKSLLGGSSSSGELSEDQKTVIKDLIANWPGLFRLVEKFFERNDDNDEYEKKT